MKKIISMIGVVMFAILSLVVVPAQAATDWDVSGSYDVEFHLLGDPTGYVHDMNLTQLASGVITAGNGGHPNEGLYAYTWNVTSGTVVGDTITLTIDYVTGAFGTTMHMTGTIAPGGTMSGVWDDNFGGVNRAGTWFTTLGAAIEDVDADNDGVANGDDYCPDTTVDGAWTEVIGQNRWEVRNTTGPLTWYQNKVKKGVVSSVVGQTIEYTHGCNGHQIIALLGGTMNGHLKFGISSGLIEEFHTDLADGALDGLYLVETVTVNADDADGVASVGSLLTGHNYVFKASGTAFAGDGIYFDADYSERNVSGSWTDSVQNYESYTDILLDLKVNGGFVNWDDDATYNADHTYTLDFVGAGAPATFQVYDVYYPGNTGALTVQIYAAI